jgi:hypothetical protein
VSSSQEETCSIYSLLPVKVDTAETLFTEHIYANSKLCMLKGNGNWVPKISFSAKNRGIGPLQMWCHNNSYFEMSIFFHWNVYPFSSTSIRTLFYCSPKPFFIRCSLLLFIQEIWWDYFLCQFLCLSQKTTERDIYVRTLGSQWHSFLKEESSKPENTYSHFSSGEGKKRE